MTANPGPSDKQLPRCLVVEDDPVSAALIAECLRDDFIVDIRSTGEEALAQVRADKPDVVLLDHELPGVNGQYVCREIRKFSDAYILMVTSRNAELDRVLALSVGADDYVTKPFSPSELRARAQALLRRSRQLQNDIGPGSVRHTERESSRRNYGDLSIDQRSRAATANGRSIDLTALEFNLLTAIAERTPAVVPRAELISLAWGDAWPAGQHAIDVHIHNIRRKLRTAGVANGQITTERGVGYRFSFDEPSDE
jgi:DNA-binding response OmpR family regulator